MFTRSVKNLHNTIYVSPVADNLECVFVDYSRKKQKKYFFEKIKKIFNIYWYYCGVILKVCNVQMNL